MKKIPQKIGCIGLAAILSMQVGTSQAATEEALALEQRVKDACPSLWENLIEEVDVSQAVGDLWENDAAGRQAFIDYLQNEVGAGLSQDDLAQMASDNLTVSAECATQRMALKQYFMDKMPQDIFVAIDAYQEALGGSSGGDGLLVNVAIGRPTTQSSVLGEVGSYIPKYGSPGGVNGIIGGTADQNSYAHTFHGGSGNQQWWHVDLGEQRNIDHIKLYARQDGIPYMENIYIFISPAPFNGNVSVDTINADADVISYHHNEEVSQGDNVSIPISGSARYVRIQRPDTSYLSLEEVEVFAHVEDEHALTLTESQKQAMSLNNVALGKTARQVSTHSGAVASWAVNGKKDGGHFSGVYSHTGPASQPWWEVDLGEEKNIDHIRLFTRRDGNFSSLGNFYVFISPTPFSGSTIAQSASIPGVFFHRHLGEVSRGSDITIPLSRKGRYVRIQNTLHSYLVLGEVEIYAYE